MLANELETGLIRGLKDCVVNEIAGLSARTVPSFCSKLGMPGGTIDDAMRSKTLYIRQRIPADGPKIALIATAVLTEIDSYQISESLEKYHDRKKPQISALTRRRISGIFQNRSIANGQDEISFIRRIWPIGKMPPAYEGGQSTSLEDNIIQHTVRNDDWETPELLEHLGLHDCSLQRLFNFLEEVVHPATIEGDPQIELMNKINQCLLADGYSLIKTSTMSGSAVLKVRTVTAGSPSDFVISDSISTFYPEQIAERWAKALERRSTDTEAAITTARTLLEDVCKWILHEAGSEWEEKDDLPELYRKLAKVLNLAPDGHTEKVFKQILGSCQSVVESLGALRNKLGDAHSIGPRRVKPAPRHAELAVNLAGTMSSFLIATWKARQDAEATNQDIPTKTG